MADAASSTTGASTPGADTAGANKSASHPNWKWYVVHTYSGYEQKAKAALE